jgi:transcriptional regulator with XRE-family HTH domain
MAKKLKKNIKNKEEELNKEVEANLKKIGERLKEIRISKGYSNYENFAFENNIGRSQYGKYELGANILFDTLFRIIKIFDISIKEFFSEGFD